MKPPSSRPIVTSRLARLYKTHLDAGQSLPPSYPYPIQVWRIGSKLVLVTLGGEVVVNYGLRIEAGVRAVDHLGGSLHERRDGLHSHGARVDRGRL